MTKHTESDLELADLEWLEKAGAKMEVKKMLRLQEEEPKFPGEGLTEEEMDELLKRLLKENPLHREPGDLEFEDESSE